MAPADSDLLVAPRNFRSRNFRLAGENVQSLECKACLRLQLQNRQDAFTSALSANADSESGVFGGVMIASESQILRNSAER